jgi:hypothetical protein
VNHKAKFLLIAYPSAPPEPPTPFPKPEATTPVTLIIPHIKTKNKDILAFAILTINSLA